MQTQTQTYYCNNCGKRGHNFHQCKLPITSYGIIAYRNNPETHQKEYLMICRKHTLGFMDFMRGKYNVYNKYYIFNMIKQMTVLERHMLLNADFDTLWRYAWNIGADVTIDASAEETTSRDKFQFLRNGINKTQELQQQQQQQQERFSLASLIEDAAKYHYEEPEWGFPKGRRELNENDLECALREFYEETGYKDEILPPGLDARKHARIIENVMPFEETFMGSNYKTYRHRYYLMNMDYQYSLQWTPSKTNETSAICWMPFLQCLNLIRQYNLEKRKILICVNSLLLKYKVL